MVMMPSLSDLAVAINHKRNITTNPESSLTFNSNGSSVSAASMKKRHHGESVGVGYEESWILPRDPFIFIEKKDYSTSFGLLPFLCVKLLGKEDTGERA
ncbi:unnamed protein product [Eruca vesicaria subsp. sativa]|uniref:Uncharacterized protein n=1 Tax=Eruca vesicaria subsp. sativa TaxID=29727 RepID=A0ABC8IRJ7_ERUVS|nr:unnamed protein product [Eruca vesicaria subsp. sativa]CAH8363498.1 unnamed protein product [Eruca vesicaria subsp. sativa]